MQIYIQHNGQQLGPFTEAEFRAKLASGEISSQDHVWYQGMANWMPVAQSPLAGTAAPGLPGQPSIPPVQLEAKTSGLAIASLICAIVGILFAPLEIAAIVLGHISLGQIKKNPALKGRGLALGGIITGYAYLVLVIISIIAISVLIALGNQVKDTFKTIQAQENSAQSQNSPDTTTNAPDQSAPAPAPTTTPDQSTNSDAPTTNSPDQNAMPSTSTSTPTATPTDSSTTNSTPATVTP